MTETVCAIVVYAGSEKLVAMTERMVETFNATAATESCDLPLLLVANAPDRFVDESLVDGQIRMTTNVGFGNAVNFAIEHCPWDPDWFLVLNNDLVFEDMSWWTKLWEERDPAYVICPTTDRTANPRAVSLAATDAPPFLERQVSAYAWLVHKKVIAKIKRAYGFLLFDPDFFAYGEDDYTGAILRKLLGPRPFKVVRRSWVRHLKGQTGAEMNMGGGMASNLKLLKQKMRAHKLTL